MNTMSFPKPAVSEAPARWLPAHVAAIATQEISYAPVIGPEDIHPLLPGLDIWDMWPLAQPDGQTADCAGATLWFALSAPQLPDPLDRHGRARIRLLAQRGTAWTDCGDLFPDNFAPGSRDWSGSAILEGDTVTLFFTAAGRAGEPRLTVEQRLFLTTGKLDLAGPRITGWTTPREIVTSDDDVYVRANQAEGAPGELKAFRDPGYFRDPADGAEYVVFAASYKPSLHACNGMAGIARADDAARTRWTLLPPLALADGVNNELERPEIVHHAGLYYLFWSTQTHVFQPGGPAGPSGLYGMVAPSLFGPYQPLNGTGLVFANPPDEPMQAYSWWVMGDLSVTSFVDYWGMKGRALKDHPELLRAQFGGVPAPFLHLALNGATATLVK